MTAQTGVHFAGEGSAGVYSWAAATSWCEHLDAVADELDGRPRKRFQVGQCGHIHPDGHGILAESLACCVELVA
ncbi:hypothetical protein ACF1AY_11035 [Streptomyces sp. NPDC014776]|uniref:hypothetical protein n=1 Tax=unclassified Streptomyces TaxID=2593676 RepID=UPI003701114D